MQEIREFFAKHVPEPEIVDVMVEAVMDRIETVPDHSKRHIAWREALQLYADHVHRPKVVEASEPFTHGALRRIMDKHGIPSWEGPHFARLVKDGEVTRFFAAKVRLRKRYRDCVRELLGYLGNKIARFI